VRVGHRRKLDAILSAVETLRAAGYTFVTMHEAARAL
jgi:hypothetical protein